MRLILLNMTTVEQMRVQDMKEHESAMLAETYSMCALAKKRRAQLKWDEEWGRPAIEGNIWWLGSERENWESVMGKSVSSWFREFRCSVILPCVLVSPFHIKCRLVRQRTTVWITQSTRGLIIRVGGANERNGRRT